MDPFFKESQQCSGLQWKECCQKVQEEDCSSLFNTGEGAPGVLVPVLDSSVQGDYGSAGENPMKGQKEDA